MQLYGHMLCNMRKFAFKRFARIYLSYLLYLYIVSTMQYHFMTACNLKQLILQLCCATRIIERIMIFKHI